MQNRTEDKYDVTVNQSTMHKAKTTQNQQAAFLRFPSKNQGPKEHPS
jgi:hypothetical protein